MNWNKAKNYTILLLIILNLGLFGLNLRRTFSDRLSGSEIDNIVKVLGDNDISVETEIPTGSKSLSPLELGSGSYDPLDIVNIFFESSISVKRTEEFNTTIFRADKRTLRIRERLISFTDEDKHINTREEAYDTAEKYMEKLGKLFPGFEYEAAYSQDEEIFVEYDMYYKNNNCFNNKCVFLFNDEGMNITVRYSEPVGFSEGRSKVYTADIILFSFMNEIKRLYPDEHITVTEIKSGYYADLKSKSEHTEALPCFRIRIKEKDQVYFINGYTGNFVAAEDD